MWYKALKPICKNGAAAPAVPLMFNFREFGYKIPVFYVLLHFYNRIGDISTKAPYIPYLHIVLWVTLSVSHQSDKKND